MSEADLIALVDKQLYGRRITEMQILLMEKRIGNYLGGKKGS
jgi:hypothetical protein